MNFNCVAGNKNLLCNKLTLETCIEKDILSCTFPQIPCVTRLVFKDNTVMKLQDNAFATQDIVRKSGANKVRCSLALNKNLMGEK